MGFPPLSPEGIKFFFPNALLFHFTLLLCVLGYKHYGRLSCKRIVVIRDKISYIQLLHFIEIQ